MRKQATRKPSDKNKSSLGFEMTKQRLQEGLILLLFALGIYLLLALVSYSTEDPSWRHLGLDSTITNIAGPAGAWLSDMIFLIFGYSGFFFPIMLIYGISYFAKEKEAFHLGLFLLRSAGFICTIIAIAGIFELSFSTQYFPLPHTAGGIIGQSLTQFLISIFSQIGTVIICFTLVLAGITLYSGLSWLVVLGVAKDNLISFCKYCVQSIWQGVPSLFSAIINYRPKLSIPKLPKKEPRLTPSLNQQPPLIISEPEPAMAPSPTPIKKSNLEISKPVEEVELSARFKNEKQENLFLSPMDGDYIPPLSLLDVSDVQTKSSFSTAKLEQLSRDVEQRLKDFGVDVQVVAVHPGPVVTRFEMQLAPGIKVSKITGLAKDLARSLSVVSVRVVEVIPGKSVVGLELPNENRAIVRLSEVLASKSYDQARSPISLALGKDISGNPVIVDLAKMPHLLVAGTTGSGKSVGINAMILSILFKSSPNQVRLILIDPKMLELSVYDDIPHLLTPVVTDMREAANSLRWCVSEMERRYRLMAKLGVRNLAGYNKKVNDAHKNEKPILDPFADQHPDAEPVYLTELPAIVVVIDEFADMMMVVGKKVEQLIARIAQKARAAGIHLILATQRPSVDVITGLIKSNIPTRIAFQVSSKIDSRTILDQQGADQLLGHGDMLYLPPGSGTPIRVHGAFVDDHEVHKVAQDWREQAEPQYLLDITHTTEEDEGDMSSGARQAESDPLYDQAVAFVLDSRKASISSVQRRLKIGYNRAARIIEDMEAAGLVSPMESNGSREVLAPAHPGE